MISMNGVLFQRLQDIREDLDLTQKDLADQLEVSQACYSRWETGKELIPLRKLNDFCNITGHSMDYVVGLISTERSIGKEKFNLNPKEIGQKLKEIRIQKGLYQHQLAKLLNTTQSTISAYEKGETLILTAFAYQLAKQLHLSLDELCGRMEKSTKVLI